MGTKCDPTYAALVIGHFEENVYRKLAKKDTQCSNLIVEQWLRFLDDCFI